MIQIIDPKLCEDGVVKYSPYIGMARNSHLLVSPDEIILLSNNNDIFVNKYEDNIKINGYCPELFEFDKIYLHYSYSYELDYNPERLKFKQIYFTKYSDKILRLSEDLIIDESTKIEEELSYDDIKEMFNISNYDCDALYIMDDNGAILFVGNKHDGCVCRIKEIPRGLKDNMHIAAPLYRIIVNDVEFDVKYFDFKKVEADKFIVTTMSIPVNKPILDVDYCLKHSVEHYSGIFSRQKVKR